MKVEIVEINKIKTGKRYRTDYGNLDDLANSIKTHGLIQPLAVSIQDTTGVLDQSMFSRGVARELGRSGCFLG